MKVKHFKTPAEFRVWLAKNHARETELWVGYYRKDSGKKGITWQESVDEALCFGWIDGVRKKVDEESYTNRFTPRSSKSTWSAINIRRAQELIEAGRMRATGLRAFEARRESRSGIYSYEQRKDQLDEPYQGRLKRNKKAWAFYQAQSPGYRRLANWWVVSAKREETRLKRLDQLIALSAQGISIREMTKKPKAK
jgi:uncharacterized protein YdeI (YjbR/CyaY-like superfamily)